MKKAHCNPKITAGPTEQGHFASTAPHVKHGGTAMTCTAIKSIATRACHTMAFGLNHPKNEAHTLVVRAGYRFLRCYRCYRCYRSPSTEGKHLQNAVAPAVLPGATGATAQAIEGLALAACTDLAERGKITPKAKAPVPEKHLRKSGSSPHRKRGFVMPEFFGTGAPALVPHGYGRDGPTRKDGRTAFPVFFTSRPPLR